MSAIPNIAVLTTRKVNPQTKTYYKPESANALRLAKESNVFRKVPLLYHERIENGIIESDVFLQNNDDMNDTNTIQSKVNMLFPENDNIKEITLYVHGFNTNTEGAKRDAQYIHDITGHPVVVFDWDSTSDLSILYVPFIGSLLPGVAKGYAKDSEMIATSVRPMNWILYVLLRGIDKVNIMSHSMGARIVVGSINSISHDYRLTQRSQQNEFRQTQEKMLNSLGTVVIKQPDVDILNMSRCIMNDLSTINAANNNAHMYIYAHDRDSVLGLSQEIHYNIQRVGQLCGAAQLLEVLDPNIPQYLHIINATSCEGKRFLELYVNPFGDNSNHSYWKYGQFQQSLNYVINDPAARHMASTSITSI